VAHERLDAGARARGDREHLGVQPEVGGCLQRRDRARVVEAVDLVDRHHDRDGAAGERLGDPAIARAADALLPVDDHQRGVGLAELLLHPVLHAARQLVARPLHAREVREHELHVVAGRDARGSPAAWSGACRRRSPPCARPSR
jgi:hypothetical protein